jgi:hypothetical protein
MGSTISLKAAVRPWHYLRAQLKKKKTYGNEEQCATGGYHSGVTEGYARMRCDALSLGSNYRPFEGSY